ncbi:DUF4838 domain-containing protein [Acanthopleuribacter pedis]|uniref:DUF4838 domain-containing protein n=1 Tax=Acanthopleuribacter pedis TaxID=442870 RepID=A0A8J7U0A9_9BACT|nr:DUF4838 domain-containing protein [Acanthopleuribacter pedis]MBO1316878.1 DUF4838 domain-containing protein [Acanthopleuribacter pedis]
MSANLPGVAADGFPLYREGRWLPELRVVSGPSRQINRFTRMLIREQLPEALSSEKGVEPITLEAVASAGSAEKPVIILVVGADAQRLLGDAVSLADLQEGFVFAFPRPNQMVIAALNHDGLFFGTADFLERYLNRRWLFPGEPGWSRPIIRDLRIPTRTVVERPAFRHRKLSGMLGPGWETWGYFHKAFDYVHRHHSFIQWLPPEQYNHLHHFFPEIDGKRMVPGGNHVYVWQPCLHAEGLLEEVVNNIRIYLDCHPHQKTVSLAINDSIRWCHCQYCAPFYEEANSLGLLHASELYYPWVNQVIEEVLVTHPDIWFGLIAYANVHDPPLQNPEIHPRVIPFLTYERLRWLRGNYREVDLARHRGYRDRGLQVGWYDYIYGTPYLIPRPLFRQLTDLFRTASENGVAHFYLEIYPNFGEGPKPYLVTKLLWDPYIDVEATLRDWYVHAVGEAAAGDLAAYFAFWENYWYERVPELPWFHKGYTYLYFQFPDYLRALTFDDIHLCDTLMGRVLAKAETPEQQKRASLLYRAYRLYRAHVVSYIGLVKGEMEPGQTRIDYVSTDLRRYRLMQETLDHVFLFHPLRFDFRRNLHELNWAHPELWRDDREKR